MIPSPWTFFYSSAECRNRFWVWYPSRSPVVTREAGAAKADYELRTGCWSEWAESDRFTAVFPEVRVTLAETVAVMGHFADSNHSGHLAPVTIRDVSCRSLNYGCGQILSYRMRLE
jgi:hypothetical protein